MLRSAVRSRGKGRTAALIAWAEAERRGSTRGRQLGPLTGTLPELMELEVSWLSSASIIPHLTSEQVRLEGGQQGLALAEGYHSGVGISGGGEKRHGRHSVACADTLP